MRTVQGRAIVAGTLALAGGVAAVLGSFLAWAEISAGPFSERAIGIDGWEGKATIVGGVVMLVAGIRVFAGSDRAVARLRLGAAIGGLVAAGVGLYTALTVRDQLLDVAATELPRAEVERALDTGLLQISIAVGLYLVIAGGIQGILAATTAVGIADRARARSGVGLRGWSAASDRVTRGPVGTPPAATNPETLPPGPGRAPDAGGGSRG